MLKTFSTRTILILTVAFVVVLGSGTMLLIGVPGGSDSAPSGWDVGPVQVAQVDETTVSEPAYEEPVPEPGDPYFEAEGSSWVSYENPRDGYQLPFEGRGSGKLCVTLLNEQGEPIVGESIPDTTVTVPTGDTLEWHPDADPMTVAYPLTEHYDRPLDSDQFGTTPDLPQGDGYLDSHCIEWHGISETAPIEYGEAEIDGEHADRVEVVGYHQQAHQSWETDVDPIEDAVSYEEAGGGWTYDPEHSHGQVVVVLQLDGDGETSDGDGETSDGDSETDEEEADDTTDDGSGEQDETDGAGDTENTTSDGTDAGDDGQENDTESGDDVSEVSDPSESDDPADDSVPGFGLLVALGAILGVSLLGARRTLLPDLR